jgi:hypothetical protein
MSDVPLNTRTQGLKRLGWPHLAILLTVLLVAALWMARRPSRRASAGAVPGGTAAPSVPFTTVEQAEQQRQKQIDERLADPVYREQLAAVTSQRRKLAAEAHALQAEIDDWRQAAAATNAVFAAAFEAWARGRQAADAGDAAATAALPAQEAGLEQRMAADVRGAGLLARRRELEARRGALDDEARQRVGERIRRQIERPAAPRKDAEKPEAAE